MTRKATIYTLNIGNYEPAICALTHPLLRRYANKIGADFHIINERRWPHLPLMCEKLQLHDLAKQRGDDWAIFLDSDALVHPDMMDVTEVVPRDTVFYSAVDYAACRYTYDDYFRRDGRHIASANWFAAASSWCFDLWKPLDDLSVDEAVSRIKPLESEAGIEPAHLIDDFIISRNIARFGLKVITLRNILAKIGQVPASFLWHEYTMDAVQKLAMMKRVLHHWTGGAFQE